MNLAAMERKITELAVLDAIPHMSHEERANKRAEYQAEVDRLERVARQALENAQQVQDRPDYWALRALSAAMRQHRTAEIALERLEQAIAKAEQADEQDSTLPSHHPRGKRKRTTPWLHKQPNTRLPRAW